MAAEEAQPREQIENQIWNAIAAFEQIVETIPDDRVSLEALSHAYEQVGDLSRARDYLVRLANVIAGEQDREAAALLRERLNNHADDNRVRDAAQRLDTLLAAGKPAREFELSPETADKAGSAPGQDARRKNEETERRGAHVAAELAFAWSLFEGKQLSQEEYAQIAQDLSEVSTSQTPVTISVLHALHDRTHRNLDNIIAYAARESGTPVIPLSLFDVQEFNFQILPQEFIIRYGAMVFEMMAKDALVAILNPFNKNLRAEVEKLANRRCHFFLTTPADFDAVVEKRTQPEKTAAAEKTTP